MKNTRSENQLLLRVFKISIALIPVTVLFLCLVFQWDVKAMIMATSASLVASLLPVICLHVQLVLVKFIRSSPLFSWMMLFAMLPVLSFAVALFSVNYLPGKIVALVMLLLAAGYSALLANGNSIAEYFKTNCNE